MTPSQLRHDTNFSGKHFIKATDAATIIMGIQSQA